ncbi:MAG TPA: hypothetical protein VHE55_17645 [Fimbriimonadaceae bacterium]|nr:hypothetical protein [Fimbriimonadaceae bacterium]
MDVRDALKGQYHAALRMLRECVQVCPDEMWTGGKFPRYFWRIAYHAAFYGDLYMSQGEGTFTPWHKHNWEFCVLWEEKAVEVEPLTKADLCEYIDDIRSRLDATIDGLDLDTSDPGFPWYKNINKLEHELLSIRHIQGHVGQLSERLFEAGIDTSWIARRA